MPPNKKAMRTAAIILILIAAGVGAYFGRQENQKTGNEVRLTGRIVGASFEGMLDGDDYLTVNSGADGAARKIQIKIGGGKAESSNEWGEVKGINLSRPASDCVGQTVRVYAVKYVNRVDSNNTFTEEMLEDQLTLQGSNRYFVETIR